MIAKIYNEKIPVTIDEKVDLILKNNLAIYDVIKSCDIEGSSDSSIKNVEINDINKIIFNGNKAYELYNKYESNKFTNLVVLPSTSTANARFFFAKLYETWKNQILL